MFCPVIASNGRYSRWNTDCSIIKPEEINDVTAGRIGFGRRR
jgi:hypothetical protein